MLIALHYFFMCFHAALVIFNISGWAFRKTKRLNLLTLSLTAFSWVFLGFRYGFGYCPLTDWHYDVLEQLGHENLPDSYIKFLIDSIFKTNLDPGMVNASTLIIFCISLVCSIISNFYPFGKRG